MQKGLFIGEGFFDVLGYVVDRGFLGELANVGLVGFFAQAHLGGDVAVHAEDGCDLFFGEYEDLEHEVVALVGAAAEAGLADEDEAGGEDRLHGDDGLKKREGFGVEVMGVGEAVEDDPGGEDAEMCEDEGERPDEGGDVVGEALGGGAAGEELFLVLGDELDLGLDVGHRRKTVEGRE